MFDKQKQREELDNLKESITTEEMRFLLSELGAQNFDTNTDRHELITNTICHNISDGSMKLYYFTNSFNFHCFTGCGESFDIFELVIRNNKLKGVDVKLNVAINWVLRKLGREEKNYKKPEGFGNQAKNKREEIFWMDELEERELIVTPMPVHNDMILDLFFKQHHPLFLEDGITHEAMDKFEIMYYEPSNRIVIPHRHYETGNIIGLKSRSLDFSDIDAGFKYIPMRIQSVQYSYPTYQNLYGLYQNKKVIRSLKKIIIFESEKSVMQFEAFFPNNNFSVAICGTNMNQLQVEMILNLGVTEVILALDKEYETENSILGQKMYEKLERMAKGLNLYTKVSIIWDNKGLLGFKDSPSDKGVEVFAELFKNRKIL